MNLPELAKALLDAGADVAARLKNDGEPLSDRLKQSLDVLGLESGIDHRNSSSPLHIAAKQTHEVAAVLLAAGADIHAKDKYGNTPLHHAAWANAPEAAERLIAAGADIHARGNDGDAPLHHAAWANAPEAAERLIAAGADIHAKNNDGITPLHHAAWNNALEAALVLIAHGADIWARDSGGRTPIDVAEREGASKVLEVLTRSREALVTHLGDIDIGGLRDSLGRAPSPTATDENGWTDLHYAAALNLPDLAKALLDAGADVEAGLLSDEEPLTDQLKQSLNDLGLEPVFTRQGYTPLHIAALHDSLEVAVELIARGADVNARNGLVGGFAPLHIAASRNAHKVATELIAVGLLQIAAENNAPRIAAALITGGANTDYRSTLSRRTALQIAEKLGHSEVLEILHRARKNE